MRDLRDLVRFMAWEWMRGMGMEPAPDCACLFVPSPVDKQPLRVLATSGEGWDHASVSRADRCPTWEEMEHVKRLIFREDETGVLFAEALASKARAGLPVRLIYDWMGGLGKTSRKFWRALAAAGVTVRCFTPPHPTSPFSWLQRDHRKMLAVDGRIGFVTGLCVGSMWVGDPARGRERRGAPRRSPSCSPRCLPRAGPRLARRGAGGRLAQGPPCRLRIEITRTRPIAGKQPPGVRRLLLRRKARVGDAAVLRLLGRRRVVASGRLVDRVEAPGAAFLELAR